MESYYKEQKKERKKKRKVMPNCYVDSSHGQAELNSLLIPIRLRVDSLLALHPPTQLAPW